MNKFFVLSGMQWTMKCQQWLIVAIGLGVLIGIGAIRVDAADLGGQSTDPVISVDRLPVGEAHSSFHVVKPRLTPLGDAKGLKFAPPIVGQQSQFGGSTITAATPSLKTTFLGVDDSGRYTPADNTIAAGPVHVVQAVNSLFRITNKSGGSPVTVDPQNLFSAFYATQTNLSGPFDPWAVYDHFAQRFVIVWDTVNNASDTGYFLIQVSKTSDPTQGWDLFTMRSDLDNSTDTSAWGDYEKLGFDNTNFYLTANQFSSAGPFIYSKIRVMSKSQFYSPTGNPIQYFDFVDPKDSQGVSAFTVQPCLTFGASSKEYLVSAPFPSGNYLSLYSITGTWPNATNTPPTLTVEGGVTFNAWNSPSNMSQPGTGAVIDGGDDRLLNAVYRNGIVYTGHSIGTSQFSTAAGIKSINVASKTKGLDVALGAAGEFYSWPVVMADAGNNVYTVFNRCSSSVFSECRYSIKMSSDTTFQSSKALSTGTTPYPGFRWGDYNGIAADPSSGVWFFSMMARNNFYQTQVGYLAGTTVGPPPPPPSTNVIASYSPATQTLSIIGDKGKNSISIVKSGNNLKVEGGTATKVNDKFSEVFVLPAGTTTISLDVDLKEGADILSIDGVLLLNAIINMGPGADNLTIKNSPSTVMVINADTSAANVAGADSVVLQSSDVSNSLTCNLGPFNDTFSLSASTVKSLNLQMGTGDDTTTLAYSSLTTLTVEGGAGIDTLVRTTSTVTNTPTITNVP